MQGDIFTSSKSNMPEKVQADDNFFVQQDYFSAVQPSQQPNRHLNDYDYNLLKEDAYKDISDDVFRLEYQISKTENELKSLDMQIQAAKDIRDFELAETLFGKRKEISDTLRTMTAMYKNASLSAKISGGVAAKFKGSLNETKEGIVGVIENLISKLPFKFKSVLEVRNSLERLENINKSVDELMSMQIPYGEANYRYDILSKYISKANSIQAEISKYINK